MQTIILILNHGALHYKYKWRMRFGKIFHQNRKICFKCFHSKSWCTSTIHHYQVTPWKYNMMHDITWHKAPFPTKMHKYFIFPMERGEINFQQFRFQKHVLLIVTFTYPILPITMHILRHSLQIGMYRTYLCIKE